MTAEEVLSERPPSRWPLDRDEIADEIGGGEGLAGAAIRSARRGLPGLRSRCSGPWWSEPPDLSAEPEVAPALLSRSDGVTVIPASRLVTVYGRPRIGQVLARAGGAGRGDP